jgi:hypothetical protein
MSQLAWAYLASSSARIDQHLGALGRFRPSYYSLVFLLREILSQIKNSRNSFKIPNFIEEQLSVVVGMPHRL